MDAGTVIAFLTATGAGAILLKLVEGIVQWATGKSKREHDAWAQRDEEAQKRRLLEEYAHTLRRELIDRGIEVEDIPQWPTYSKDK